MHLCLSHSGRSKENNPLLGVVAVVLQVLRLESFFASLSDRVLPMSVLKSPTLDWGLLWRTPSA